ncbi:hypothetical protein [Fenollaria sporofastidiosus]|uniref:hypothetical protein n=1 Tax=Fenollaria sporofastidiosus TaxID=2811778 RepID=UPI001C0067B6|nr:hypothetical protein [Fenollaria sporofastidiosus]
MDKTRKRILTIVGILILVLMLFSFTSKKVIYRYMPNSVANQTIKKMKEASKGMTTDEKKVELDENEMAKEEAVDNDESKAKDEDASSEEGEERGYDYDLTGNDADMNYVIVAMIAEDPKSFEGIKIKLRGLAIDLETTDTSGMDHYVVINDRQACCQQGLQYILKDKNQKYPKEQEMITVEGELTVFNSEEIPFPLAVIKNARLISR